MIYSNSLEISLEEYKQKLIHWFKAMADYPHPPGVHPVGQKHLISHSDRTKQTQMLKHFNRTTNMLFSHSNTLIFFKSIVFFLWRKNLETNEEDGWTS